MTTDEQFFSFTVKTQFESKRRFDQCGIVMYLDSENWLKASIEYENEAFQHLGSVVTNNGYSDWATTEIDASIKSMWYRLSAERMITALNAPPTAYIFPRCAYVICSMAIKPYVSAYMPAAPRILRLRQFSPTCRLLNANGFHMMASSRIHEDAFHFVVILYTLSCIHEV